MNCRYCFRPVRMNNGYDACYKCRKRIKARKSSAENKRLGRIVGMSIYDYLVERAK